MRIKWNYLRFKTFIFIWNIAKAVTINMIGIRSSQESFGKFFVYSQYFYDFINTQQVHCVWVLINTVPLFGVKRTCLFVSNSKCFYWWTRHCLFYGYTFCKLACGVVLRKQKGWTKLALISLKSHSYYGDL